MALFNNTLDRAQRYFPELKIKYKNESLLMKIIAKILFFNKDFMSYTTTLGLTIYFPSTTRVKTFPVSNTIVLLHELSHIFNSKKSNFFKFLYLFPQILSLLFVPVFIIFGLKLALPFLLLLLPIPAYFRMKEEKQAYTISLYVMKKLNDLYNLNIDLDHHKNSFVEEFSNSSYYFMWPFPSVEVDFEKALADVKSGVNPDYDPKLYEIIDNLLEE